jgi:hypothetical protein
MAYIMGFPLSLRHLDGEYPPGIYFDKVDSSSKFQFDELDMFERTYSGIYQYHLLRLDLSSLFGPLSLPC